MLWGHVAQCARRLVGCIRSGAIDSPCETEIRNMGLKIGVQEHIAGLIIPVNNAQTMQKTEAISHTPHTLNPGPPRSRGCGHVLFLLQPLVQTAISNKLVYEEPIGPVHAIAENLNDFRVVEHT